LFCYALIRQKQHNTQVSWHPKGPPLEVLSIWHLNVPVHIKLLYFVYVVFNLYYFLFFRSQKYFKIRKRPFEVRRVDGHYGTVRCRKIHTAQHTHRIQVKRIYIMLLLLWWSWSGRCLVLFVFLWILVPEK